MASCPACGKENPEGFAFCGYCTSPLTDRPATAALEERKVVSVLFCDLVGFTAASEQADPEDVRARMFASMGYKPALAEIEALLAQTAAAAS